METVPSPLALGALAFLGLAAFCTLGSAFSFALASFALVFVAIYYIQYIKKKCYYTLKNEQNKKTE